MVPFKSNDAAQGTTDLLMGIAGASAALLSGLVVGLGSYGLLATVATVLLIPLVVGALRPSTPRVAVP